MCGFSNFLGNNVNIPLNYRATDKDAVIVISELYYVKLQVESS